MVRSFLSRRQNLIWVVLMVLAISALACGSGTTETDGGGTGSSGSGTVTVVNNSSVEICFLYISPSGTEEWGADQLGDTGVVSPGSSFDINNIPAGTYDLRADDCSNTELAREDGVELPAGQVYTWTFSDN
jgi:hypothetical protein